MSKPKDKYTKSGNLVWEERHFDEIKEFWKRDRKRAELYPELLAWLKECVDTLKEDQNQVDQIFKDEDLRKLKLFDEMLDALRQAVDYCGCYGSGSSKGKDHHPLFCFAPRWLKLIEKAEGEK